MSEQAYITAYLQTLDLLEENIRPLQAQYGHYMQCGKGCSSCCSSGFTIRYIEALYLMQGLSAAPPEVLQAIRERLHDTSPEGQSKCPLLVDDACSLYAYRPTLCRAYGVVIKLGEDFSTCPLNFKTVPRDEKIKSLGIDPFYALLNNLSQELWVLAGNSAESVPRLTIRQFLTLFLEQPPATATPELPA